VEIEQEIFVTVLNGIWPFGVKNETESVNHYETFVNIPTTKIEHPKFLKLVNALAY